MIESIQNDVKNSILEEFKLVYILANYLHKLDRLHEEIQDIALHSPAKIAIIHEQERLSFQDLEDLTNQLANCLLKDGISAEDTVGIYLKESPLLPISILGTLKAGGTYVPLSLDYPVSRVTHIGNEANFKFIITDADIDISGFKNKPKVIHLKNGLEDLSSFSKTYTPVKVENHHAAYIMFTSGSTGNPKGVVIEHRSLSSYLEWYLADLQSVTEVNLPLTSSICFAASVTQLYTPLLLGEPLHILDRNHVKNPEAMLKWYQEHEGFGLYCVPTLWEEIINFAESSDKQWLSPECVYLSGEALPKKLADRTFEIWPNISLWNLYGPTEATANISTTQVQKGEDIHLGKPIRGGNIYILDEQMQKVPNGQEGYVYLSSRALARGYLNQPELSDKTFIADHHLVEFDGSRLYNTGDRGMLNENNELIFLGRNDQQVKIRGHRIELAEIEQKLKENPLVRQSACKIIDDGDKKIVAFVVADQQAHTDTLLEYLRERLPEYMLPEQIIFIDEMPKLANGKINKKALTVSNNRPDLSYAKTASSTPEEATMLSVWENTLKIKGLGMNDNFFDLGGNSLKLIQLASKVKTAFQKTVTVSDIWDHATPSALVALLDTKEEETPAIIIKQDVNVEKQSYPLTFNQNALWFIHQSRPDQTAYNMLFSIDFEGNVADDVLRKAIAEITNRHTLLKSNFKIENKNPIRFIAQKEIDFTTVQTTKENAQVQYQEIEQNAFSRRYDLAAEHLVKYTFVKSDQSHSRLFVELHHIIFDGISINLYINELLDELDGKAVKSIQADYAGFEKDWKKNYYAGALENDYQFWKNTLEGANHFLNLPTDFVRPKIQSYQGRTKAFTLHENTKQKLESFCSSNQATNFMTLLSVFYVLLHKYTREEDILVGVPFGNRTKQEFENVIGLFTNTLVFRSKLKSTTKVNDLIQHIKTYTKDALSHQSFPFDKLVEKLNPERNISANPIFQVMFAYHAAFDMSTKQLNGNIEAREHQNPNCKFDLDLEVQEETASIVLNFNYNTSLFKEETIDLFATQFEIVLNQIIADKDLEIKDISLFPNASITSDSVQGATIEVKQKFLHEKLEEQAKSSPKSIALSYQYQALTYEELNQRANQFARYLLANGAKKNVPVAIIAERSMEMMVAIFGILKAGTAYLPLDTNHPIERINTILNESGAEIVVDLCGKITDSTTLKVIRKDDESDWANEAVDNLNTAISGTDLAYVIFTSGTTNTPKGVMITHEAIINRIDWMQNEYPIDQNDTLIQKTAYTFDVSVWELFWWTNTGSTLRLLASDEEKNPEIIVKTIIDHKITVIHFVPSMLNTFLEYIALGDGFKGCNLKYIFTSGEALETYHVEKFNALNHKEQPIALINLYGPTEASVDVTHFHTANATKGQKIPIGKPIQNTGIHIIDEYNQELPTNIPGELAISGIGLAKGYLNQQKLTEEKFITNNGVRYYKTGDLARILPDGNVDFMGRIDSQVKIRGYRIELGEIEAQLMKHENVSEAVVVVREFSYEDKRLAAYVVLKNKQVKLDFRRYLKTVLPDYMVPSAFLTIDTIPLSSSGKVNSKQLPDPFKSKEKVIGEKAFNNEYEVRLAKIWTQILKTDAFDLHDNFYDVGGYSLLLVSMKSMIDKEFKVDISILELFQYTSITSLAEVLATKKRQKNKSQISSRAAMRRMAISKARKQ